MRVVRTVPLISANARSATPLYVGLSDEVNACLIPRLRHSFPNSPPTENLYPIVCSYSHNSGWCTSVRTSARIVFNALGLSDFLPRKYTRVNYVQYSRTMSVYNFPPILDTVIFLQRSSPLRLTPCFSAVCLSSTSNVWPSVQWKVLMSVGDSAAFACPGAITTQPMSNILLFASGWYPYLRQSFSIRVKCTVYTPSA